MGGLGGGGSWHGPINNDTENTFLSSNATYTEARSVIASQLQREKTVFPALDEATGLIASSSEEKI